jgi:hypothetical protein
MIRVNLNKNLPRATTKESFLLTPSEEISVHHLNKKFHTHSFVFQTNPCHTT